MTIKDAYPNPRIDESLSKLGIAKLHLGSAFWQVPLRKQDCEKTGFACELGLFQWKSMPFGFRSEEDAVRKRMPFGDSHIPATDGPGTHEPEKEIREPHHVLCR